MKYFKNFEPRLYQQTIFANATKKNSLVVLPTGLGKTAISMMLAASRLTNHPGSKIVILAPTRPLVHQHLESFQDYLDPQFIRSDDMVVFTGQTASDKRIEIWKEAKIIFSTPQGLENDILSGKIRLADVSLIVFDEAHRATGDYSYVWIASQYMRQAKNKLILALTASPGSNNETIKEVCKNLFIEHIEVKDKESPDVKPYVKETKINWVELDLPKIFHEIIDPLTEMLNSRLKLITKYLQQVNPRAQPNAKFVSKKDLLGLQAKLQGLVGNGADTETFTTISIVAQIIKIQHAVELLETQGVATTRTYMDDIWQQGLKNGSKAVQNIVADPNFKIAISKLWALGDSSVEHPKLKKIVDIISDYIIKKPDAKIIVFNNYRDSISNLKQLLDTKPGINSEMFVGQAKKKGMGITQKEQLRLIEDFRNNVHNVMIMSSVGEEGLDIPAVDLVIFYEPVPSAIRQIQRIGRTGRQEKGEVIILIARGTRDVAYFWSTKNKQRKMYDVLGAVKKELALEASVGLFDNAKQLSLKEAAKETKKYTTANSDSNLNFPSQQSPAKIIPDESNSYLADSDVSDNKASINKRILDLNASIANDGSNDKTTMNVSDSKNKKLNEFNETEKVILKDLEKQVEIQKKLEAQKDANEVANTRTIVVDAREKANRIVKHFVDDGFLIDVKQLAVGDYILTDEIGIEFKTKQDFVDSIVDGRLMTQAAALARTFIKPLIVVQGEEDLYSIRNVHPNSIIGAMSTIAVSFKIPVLFTRNEQETYQLFLSLAKKQTQKLEHNPRTLKPKEAKEEQEFIVSGLPGIGIGLAKDLLKHFKSIGNILSADEEELAKVDGIGKTKAKKIKEMLKKEYEG